MMKSVFISAFLVISATCGATRISSSAAPVSSADVVAAPKGGMLSEWTFDDCVNWATANATTVRRNLLDILQAEQDILSAKDAWMPNVGFSTNQTFTNYPSPEYSGNGNIYGSSYGVNADWTVWDGNLRKYRLESSRLVLSQQRLEGEDIANTLKLGLLQAYMNIMYAREAVAIARQTLEVSEAQAKRAFKLMESGRSSKVDYAQIESQRAQDAYSLVQAENNLEDSRLALKKILELGLAYDLRIANVDFPDSEVTAPLPDKETVFSSAIAWLPSFKSNALSKEIYANDVKIAKTGMLPSINLNGGIGTGYTSGGTGWGSQMGHNFNENIGVTLNVPIYDGNATRRAVAKARLAELEYDLTQKTLLDDLSQTIESLYIDASNARAGYISGQSRLEAAALTNELTSRQFELGLVNPLELLTAHNNYLNARLELLRSKYMAILASKTIDYYMNGSVALP